MLRGFETNQTPNAQRIRDVSSRLQRPGQVRRRPSLPLRPLASRPERPRLHRRRRPDRDPACHLEPVAYRVSPQLLARLQRLRAKPARGGRLNCRQSTEKFWRANGQPVLPHQGPRCRLQERVSESFQEPTRSARKDRQRIQAVASCMRNLWILRVF